MLAHPRQTLVDFVLRDSASTADMCRARRQDSNVEEKMVEETKRLLLQVKALVMPGNA